MNTIFTNNTQHFTKNKKKNLKVIIKLISRAKSEFAQKMKDAIPKTVLNQRQMTQMIS